MIGKYQKLSGSVLKMIAVILMIIDHTAGHILTSSYPLSFSVLGRTVTLYQLMRWAGRLSFPIFAFLITEGFIHTHDRRKYGRNLLVFALISEIPWNLEHSGTFFYNRQNVMFTLLLGFMGLYALEEFADQRTKQAAALLLLFGVSFILKADYGYRGFGLILSLYVLRKNRVLQCIIGICLLTSSWIGGLAFIPINLYNGKRGFIQSSFAKYLMYAIYPVHMLILYYIRLKTIGF